jgi:hypothetical protein
MCVGKNQLSFCSTPIEVSFLSASTVLKRKLNADSHEKSVKNTIPGVCFYQTFSCHFRQK